MNKKKGPWRCPTTARSWLEVLASRGWLPDQAQWCADGPTSPLTVKRILLISPISTLPKEQGDTPEKVKKSSLLSVYPDQGDIHATPSWSMTNAITQASSRQDSYRPDGPMWPAPIWVLSRTGRSPRFNARSLATHFAGSQYETRGSLRPAVASTAGYSACRRLS